jgi:hypothetical protein
MQKNRIKSGHIKKFVLSTHRLIIIIHKEKIIIHKEKTRCH